jgi:hypothetical protein
MRSVADKLRKATRDSTKQLSVDERIEQAFRLGDDDLKAYADARGISLTLARNEIAQRRRAGRRPSGAADGRQR